MAELIRKQNRTHRRRVQIFENLIQAGFAVIAQRGLYGTTVQHITEAADVGKGTFYAHFRSKEDLVQHLVHHGFDALIAAGRVTGPQGGTPAERIAGLIQAQRRMLAHRRDLVILMHQVRGLLILRPEGRGQLRREYQRYVRFLADACRGMADNSSLDPGDAKDLACAIAGFVAGTLSFEMLVRGGRGIRTPPNGPIDAFAEGIAAKYLSSVRPGSGSRSS